MDMQSQEKMVEKLRKQLGVAVRSIQWSYAIFWSLSTTQQRVLEWGEGYYNGDIMTRTGLASEGYADKLGLQRSRQLRELYESLLDGESEEGTKGLSPTLSPEDLTDLEWYYLVCMSFVFDVGQSLPGRALANGESVWLCNAQDADSKVFSRSLLAKSASVKTVICFPHSGGVLELGVTDLVPEDPNLIQRVKTSLLEFAKPTCSGTSTDQHNADYDKDSFGTRIHVMNQAMSEPEAFVEELHPPTHEMSEEFSNMSPPDDCSGNCCGNSLQEDSFILEGGNDHDLDCGIQDSCVSTGRIAQSLSSFEDKYMDNRLRFKELPELLELGGNDEDDLHYKRALAVVLQSSSFSVGGQSLCGSHKSSSFVPWKKEPALARFPSKSPQRALKAMLLTVPSMFTQNPLEPFKKDGKETSPSKPQPGNRCIRNAFTGKEREDENYLLLRSLVPSTNNKIGKTSILNDTIEHLQELEARVEELESCVNQSDSEVSHHHTSTSPGIVKMWLNKRKACDVIGENEAEPELDVNVATNRQDVLVEIRCPWRDHLLLDIMEAMNNLSLDAHTVQSTTADGILSVTLKSKFRGAAFAPARMIKQALREVVGLC